MSVYSLGLLGSMPLCALMLGLIIEGFGTLNGLIPGMVISALLFALGLTATQIYSYTSPTSNT